LFLSFGLQRRHIYTDDNNIRNLNVTILMNTAGLCWITVTSQL
jgi:hypothetical protein